MGGVAHAVLPGFRLPAIPRGLSRPRSESRLEQDINQVAEKRNRRPADAQSAVVSAWVLRENAHL